MKYIFLLLLLLSCAPKWEPLGIHGKMIRMEETPGRPNMGAWDHYVAAIPYDDYWALVERLNGTMVKKSDFKYITSPHESMYDFDFPDGKYVVCFFSEDKSLLYTEKCVEINLKGIHRIDYFVEGETTRVQCDDCIIRDMIADINERNN